MTRLFEMILQTTAGASILVVLVLLLMLALGKRYNQKWRYWVWMFIAIRLVLPFDIPHDASLFTFSIPEEKTVITYNPENNVGTQNVPDKIIIPSDTTQNIVQNPTQNAQPVIPPTTVTPPSTNNDIIIPIVPNEDVVDVTPVKTISLTQVFAVVWLVGVLGCMAWHIVMHVRFLGRAKLWNRPVAEPWANEIFNNVKKEMGITADVKLYRNRSVHSPILTGFFKPTVLIPTRNLTENDLYMVLRHELLHYKRHDLWYKLLLVAAGCLHWFNPFVWFMVKRADRDLEIACDEAVVKGESTEFRKDYCETILRIIRCDRGRKPALSTGFTTGKKTMKKRFACALDSTAKRTGVILLCLVLCATIVCSTFIACDITKKDLTRYYDTVLHFAERIPKTFANTADLENEFVSGHIFRTITNANGYKEDETGAVYIKQSEINETAKLLFGMENFVPDRELWMYYAENDNYAFYPAGEGPMYSGEITSSEEKNGTLYFTVKLTQKLYGSEDEEGYVPPKVYVITYAFTENDNDLYPLKAVKAEYDNTQEQTVFINANTLTEHLVWSVYDENYSADIPLVRTTFSVEEINRFLLHAASYIDKTEYRYSYIAEKSDDNRYPYFYSDFNIATSISEVFSLMFDWDLDTPVQEVTAAGYLVENAFGVTVQYNAQNMHSTASGNEIKTVFNLMAYTSDEEGPFYKDVGKYEAVYTINGEGLRFRYIQPYKETTSEVDVKGIGVLGYVDNAGTLPKHSVELSEKISDVNSFMFKKHRVCAYDAARNGYIVHYYDYTEGDDALSLALAVETIVKGSGLKVISARDEKGFVVVNMIPTGEEVDNTKVRELLESIACTLNTNGYYLTGFTLSGRQFDFGGITLENDGYGKYDFEPLFNQPITELELAAMRNLLIYPFTNGIPIYDGTGVAFADSVTDKNEELASLIYYTAECGEYSDFSKLSNKYTAAMGIYMVPDTYECMMVPEKWSEVVVNSYDYMYLKPLMTVISDFEFVTKEWVELAVKQIWGKDAELIHPSSTLGKWTYHALEGVYTPFHGGEGSKVLPYIHSVTKIADGYVAEVSYVTANIGGVHGRDTIETLPIYDMFENEEVVELAKRQNIYTVTAKYDDNGKLYLVSCVKKDLFSSITSEDVENAIANPNKFTEEELEYYESILDPYEHSIGVSGEVSWNDPSEIVRKLVKFYEISPGGFAEFFNKVQNKEAEAVKVSGNLMFVPADVVEDHIAKKFNIDKEAFRNEAWRLDEYEYVEQAYAFNTDMGYGGFYDYSILKVEKSGNIWKFYCSNSYPVYYGNEETYEEDYAVIVVEHKGENDYKFLCAKGFHEDKFASVRAKFVYPFSEGIRLCEETDFRFDETVPRENRDKEFASLLCYAARANKGQYQNLSFLISDRDKADAAISMLGVTTYEEKYSDIWGTLEYRSELLPFANENIFIPEEWVERAIKQIWGDDVGIEHYSSYAWEYKKDAGIYTPKGTESANIYPYIHSVTKTKNGYVAEVSYLYTGYLGVWGDTEGEARSVDAKDYSDIFATPEVVELAKEQTIYNVTAEYGSDGKLHLKSSVKTVNTTDIASTLSGAYQLGVSNYIGKNTEIVANTAEVSNVVDFLGFDNAFAIYPNGYEIVNTQKLNYFIENYKAKSADSVLVLKSGSPLPIYAVLLKFDGSNITRQMFYLRDDTLVEGETEIVTLTETDTMWIFKSEDKALDVFPKTDFIPVTFAEEGSMTVDEVAQELENICKLGYKVAYSADKMVYGHECYYFTYVDSRQMHIGSICVSKDLQRVFVTEEVNGNTLMIVK